MKRVIKLLVSLLVRAWDLAGSRLRGLAGRKDPGACVVLYYHAVEPDQRAAFARQLEEINRQAAVLPADHQERLEPGCHHVVITFDDGFVSVLENAIPELRSRKMPATIFVATGSLGQRPQWVRNPAMSSWHETVMSENLLDQFKKEQLVQIGSHSVNHPRLTQLEETEASRELVESKRDLERILGRPVELFSFPHGDHNSRLLTLAREAGYRRVFTVQPEMALKQPAEFATGRVLVDPADWMIEFRLKLAGAYRWMVATSRFKRFAGKIALI